MTWHMALQLPTTWHDPWHFSDLHDMTHGISVTYITWTMALQLRTTWHDPSHLSYLQVTGILWGHSLIQKKNGPLTTEIAILNLERMAHWNFNFIGKTWTMAHNMVCPSLSLLHDMTHGTSAIYMTWPIAPQLSTSDWDTVGPWAIVSFKRKMAHWQLKLLY